MAKILIAGCGDVGGELARRLAEAGHEVTGLKRQPPTIMDKVNYITADICNTAQLQKLTTDFDFVFFILSPDGRTEQSYRAVYETSLDNLLNHFSVANTCPCWFFISSTSVYPQSQGEWVDEDSLAEPDNVNSQLIRAAEQKIIIAHPKNIVVRFSGIYGQGREYLLRLAQQTPAIQKNPPYFTNRIHRQDCVAVLLFLLQQQLSGNVLQQCYLASDDEPVPMWEVMTWLAEKTACALPIEKNGPTIDMNKRCNNQRLKSLGYQFLCPSYKEGYLPLLAKFKQSSAF
jgi:nucleoside-diphosphate-sugar epimerase